MAADVMQGCRPGSAQLLGGLGGRLRLAYPFFAYFAFFIVTRGGPFGPAATRAQFYLSCNGLVTCPSAQLALCVRVVFASPALPLRVPLRECSEGCVIARIVFGPFRFDLHALYYLYVSDQRI